MVPGVYMSSVVSLFSQNQTWWPQTSLTSYPCVKSVNVGIQPALKGGSGIESLLEKVMEVRWVFMSSCLEFETFSFLPSVCPVTVICAQLRMWVVALNVQLQWPPASPGVRSGPCMRLLIAGNISPPLTASFLSNKPGKADVVMLF